MLTGNKLVRTLSDELRALGMKTMASTLEDMYRKPEFTKLDSLSLLAAIVEPEYRQKTDTKIGNRIEKANLKGKEGELKNCVDSETREYLPYGIMVTLSSLEFIEGGLNVCILGPSDSGKSYLAQAIGIEACENYAVEYHHCETLLEEMVALKQTNYSKFQSRMKRLCKLPLLILDDFLLHTINDEQEVKVLFELMERRKEGRYSTIVCSQREPDSWSSMLLFDDISTDSIVKRATKAYTIVIKPKSLDLC